MSQTLVGDRVGPAANNSRVINRLRKHLEGDEWSVFAGILKGATYPDGTPVATVLYVLEHGTADGKIPPRPVLRYVAAHFMPKWKRQFAKLLMKNLDAKEALARLGEIMAGDIDRYRAC